MNSSREFKLETIRKKLRGIDRKTITSIVNLFRDHGYIHSRSPLIFEADKSSYLVNHAYMDPGLISYLTGTFTANEDDQGCRIESYCCARLKEITSNDPIFGRSQLFYFKPYIVDEMAKIRYHAGEVDFVVQYRELNYEKLLPIEVKRSGRTGQAELATLRHLILEDARFLNLGILLSDAAPRLEELKKGYFLLHWPYWLL